MNPLWIFGLLSLGATFGLVIGGLMAAAAQSERITARLAADDDDEEPSLCERCEGWGLIPRRDELDECRACQGTGQQVSDWQD